MENWRYVKHIENASGASCLTLSHNFTPNVHPSFRLSIAGDFFEYLSGGYYKSIVHRVVKPPADQAGCKRLGMFYFHYTSDLVLLKPLLESPVPTTRRCYQAIEEKPDDGAVEES